MSTEQTDAYWHNQEAIMQSFQVLLEEKGYIAAKTALNTMSTDPEVHETTYRECKDILYGYEMDQGDPNDEFREHQAREEEARTDRMEEHFAPSEGYKDYNA